MNSKLRLSYFIPSNIDKSSSYRSGDLERFLSRDLCRLRSLSLERLRFRSLSLVPEDSASFRSVDSAAICNKTYVLTRYLHNKS